MKQLQITEKVIGETRFYIKPFPAFTAANISGDLAALVTPLLGALLPLVGNNSENNSDKKRTGNILDAEMDDAIPALSSAFSGLSGDQFERLMKKLLVDYKNISVESEALGGQVPVMDYDLANEVFCGDVQDMYILCWEVIKLNFRGFFKKLGVQSGGLLDGLLKKTPASENTETST